MSGGVQNDVEYVVSAEQDVAVVGEHLFIPQFSCAFQQDVHVSVNLYHFAFVFAAVFEDDFNVSVKLFYENVQRFFTGFHHSTVLIKVGMHKHKQTATYKSFMKWKQLVWEVLLKVSGCRKPFLLGRLPSGISCAFSLVVVGSFLV